MSMRRIPSPWLEGTDKALVSKSASRLGTVITKRVPLADVVKALALTDLICKNEHVTKLVDAPDSGRCRTCKGKLRVVGGGKNKAMYSDEDDDSKAKAMYSDEEDDNKRKRKAALAALKAMYSDEEDDEKRKALKSAVFALKAAYDDDGDDDDMDGSERVGGGGSSSNPKGSRSNPTDSTSPMSARKAGGCPDDKDCVDDDAKTKRAVERAMFTVKTGGLLDGQPITTDLRKTRRPFVRE